MILTGQIHSVRDGRTSIRAAKTRLESVWRDPIASHVVNEFWVPLLMEIEQLEARLVQDDTAISRQLQELRDLARDGT